jgi:hypothetical protein
MIAGDWFDNMMSDVSKEGATAAEEWAEVLAQVMHISFKDAQKVIETWQTDYYVRRQHS